MLCVLVGFFLSIQEEIGKPWFLGSVSYKSSYGVSAWCCCTCCWYLWRPICCFQGVKKKSTVSWQNKNLNYYVYFCSWYFLNRAGRKILLSLTPCLIRVATHGHGEVQILCTCSNKVCRRFVFLWFHSTVLLNSILFRNMIDMPLFQMFR